MTDTFMDSTYSQLCFQSLRGVTCRTMLIVGLGFVFGLVGIFCVFGYGEDKWERRENTKGYLRLQNLALPGFLITEESFFSPSVVATHTVPPSPSANCSCQIMENDKERRNGHAVTAEEEATGVSILTGGGGEISDLYQHQ